MLRSYCRLRLPFIPPENCFDLLSIFQRFTITNVRLQLQFFPNSRPIARGKARGSKLRLTALILVFPCAIDEILDYRKRTRRRTESREHYRRGSTPLEFYDTRVNHAEQRNAWVSRAMRLRRNRFTTNHVVKFGFNQWRRRRHREN